jgi:hypothetical protein
MTITNGHHQTAAGVPCQCEADTEGVLDLRDLLRAAIDESSWRGKSEALALFMGLPDRHYLYKMLSGDKPIGLKHLNALPDDVEAIFARRYAEQFGLIVVAPLTGLEAERAFVAGLMGVLRGRLPEKAGAPLKAELDQTAARRRA